MAINHPKTDIGIYESDVRATLARLSDANIVRRIWGEDYTVWKPEPAEIADRLGWLTVTDLMQKEVPMLKSFAQEVKDSGFRHVVLLGMGGSSLGAEVLTQVFGSAVGFPELIVLDSTIPGSIRRVMDVINPANTLFLVSSKSGTTTEPLILLRYFKMTLQQAIGSGFGQHFVAITDSGTPLATLAMEEGFRRVFLNPSTIGGRYSVLSYFGLVSAALIGVDVDALLDRAGEMRERCTSGVPASNNPGSWLGACMGSLASKGRDKLTLVTSPSISSFGLWVEQLIAESTGKEGKGIVPVANEPALPAECYGADRLFIYLRLKSDDNSTTDAALNSIKASGQPIVVLDMQDKPDFGSEFFRWEFATAIAGAVLGINPFDQPNVQKAKDATERVLREYAVSGSLPEISSSGSLASLLASAIPGDYFAIMAYVPPDREMDEALATLRRKVTEKYLIATTLGYGPRFLHSTGQLHKGGANTGLFLQITAGRRDDLPVPGEPYTFGVVADAQALGDFQALQRAGRRVVRLHLPQADSAMVRKLISGVP